MTPLPGWSRLLLLLLLVRLEEVALTPPSSDRKCFWVMASTLDLVKEIKPFYFKAFYFCFFVNTAGDLNVARFASD